MKTDLTILWDWNGTLLDDAGACAAALNVMLAQRGLPTVTLDYFRRNFAFPARSFYRLVGMDVPDSEWAALATEYHRTYDLQAKALNVGTLAALERVRAQGARQSILSALRQDLLEEITTRLGVAPYMDRLCGVNNLDGGSKLARAHELVAELRREGACRFVLIGDSLHDYEVATDLNIGCVLFAGGSHSAERLRAVAPTGETLSACLDLAMGA